MTRVHSLIRDQRGATAVEFALILPVLLGLIGGVMQYGRVLLAEQAIRDIIDSSARSAVITQATATAARTQVMDAITLLPGIADYDVTVTDGASLSISVSGSFDLAFGQFLPAPSQSFSLSTEFPR
jgi:Flp pilus assembly protein TadG